MRDRPRQPGGPVLTGVSHRVRFGPTNFSEVLFQLVVNGADSRRRRDCIHVVEKSKEVLVYLKEQGEGKEVMVPMTSSLYVPGVMEDTDNGEEEEFYTSSNTGSYDNRSSFDLLVNFNIFLQLFILICCLIFPPKAYPKLDMN